MLRARFPVEIRRAVPEYRIAQWTKVALPLLLVSAFWLLLDQTDVLMIGAIRGTDHAGLYSAASRSAVLVRFVFLAVNASAAPAISALYARKSLAELRQMIRSTTKWIFWGSLLTAMPVLALGRILLALFGTEFVPQYPILLILALGHVFAASFGLVMSLMNMTGRQRVTMWVYGGTSAVNVALNGLLISLLGNMGAAVATAISMAGSSVVLCVLAARRMNINTFILAQTSSPAADADRKDGRTE
jgi:O-antigen/teichoic acid export membrane protein